MANKLRKDEEIFQRDGFRCVYCDYDGSSFEGWTFLIVDHFKPRSRGGSDEPDNLQTYCIICNQMKGATVYQSLEEARNVLGGYRKGMQEYWGTHVRPLLSDGPVKT